MRNVAICGAGLARLRALNESIGTVEIDGKEVLCGEMHTQAPEFDAAAPQNAHRVLLRVRAFSCNFRDKALIMRAAAHNPADRFYVVGSEFVADVVEVGSEVESVKPGDRVVGDHAWPGVAGAGYRGGIATNHASRELLVLREEKVARVPPEMDDATAAAFALGAQTAYSMVEKLGAGPGSRVLVTAARANTSLFAIDLLRRRGAEVYATTTSSAFDERLKAMGVRTLFRVGPELRSFEQHPDMQDAAMSMNGFDGVLDPFFDLHLSRVVPLLGFGGRYVTCGWERQSPGDTVGPPPVGPDYGIALQVAMIKNLELLGNCLGSRAHLEQAIADYAAGDFRVPVDSVYGDGRVADFFRRTYADGDRLGKVVYAYN